MMRWNREAAMLGIPDLPEEGFKHVGDRKIKPQGGSGGGGGGHTTSENVTYTSPVPEWLKEEQKEVVARGLALAQQPYQAYTGERISQFTPLQQRAFGAAERQQVAPQMGLATGLAGISGLSSFRDPGMAGSFMNPFLEQALAPQLAGVARESAIRGTQQQGEATQRGAFGGSRDAIMRAEREKNLMSEQANILSRGYAQAFDTAQDQFNRERAAQLAAAGQLGQLGQTQFGQEMDITGRQREFGAEQRQREQAILDQQFADFQTQRDFPYQQVGFASDIIQGRGGSTRSMFQTPQPSAIQNLAGLGTAAIGLKGLMAKGGEVQHYADGGITGLLGDRELRDQAENAEDPMLQLMARRQEEENAALRAAAPQGLPAMQPETAGNAEVVLTQKMVEALNRGDRRLAEELAEALEEIKVQQEVGGIAGMMPEQMAEGIPEGGIMAMAMGGEVGYSNGGDIVLPAGTPSWMVEQERMNNPGRQVRVEGEGAFWRGIGRALTYSSDVEAQRARQRAEEAGAGRGIEAGPTAEQLAQAPKPVVPKVITPPADKAAGAKDAGGKDTPPAAPADGGIAALPRGTGFDVQAAMANELGIQQGIAAGLVQGVADEEAALERGIAERGVYGEEREKRLKEEKEGLAGKKDEARNMALIQTGLAILSADPSRGALSAIGQGAMQGLGAYKGDVEKLDKDRQRILDKMDEIADIRRQETMADGKERRALVAKRNQAVVEGQKLMYNTMSRFTDISRDESKMVFEAGVRTRVAQIASSGRGDGDDRKIAAAERAFSTNPEVKMILKRAENPLATPAEKNADLDRLNAIRDNIYAQFGATMVPTSGGADMTGFRVVGVKQ